jgi:hypothetical protein
MKTEARMPQSDGGDARAEGVITTLSDMLFLFRSPKLRCQLEEFRKTYEEEFGPTDLTLRYTSTWGTPQQIWLLENHPKRYFDGLPPFVQSFLKEKMISAHKHGNLDDMPSEFLELYLKGQMDVGGGGRFR